MFSGIYIYSRKFHICGCFLAFAGFEVEHCHALCLFKLCGICFQYHHHCYQSLWNLIICHVKSFCRNTCVEVIYDDVTRTTKRAVENFQKLGL